MTGIIIPLYSYPGVSWGRVTRAKMAHPEVPFIVIINPNNGPGNSRDQNFASAVKEFQIAGVIVLGYVYTKYGERPPDTVLTDINAYVTWYGVNGIFFDEMSNSSGWESYYSTLSHEAKSRGCTYTVGNPGTNTLRSYLGTVDNLVIYEANGIPSLNLLSLRSLGLGKSDFSYLSLGVSLLDPSAIANSAYFVDYLYITDSNKDRAYDTLPAQFDLLISFLANTKTITVRRSQSVSLSNLFERIFS